MIEFLLGLGSGIVVFVGYGAYRAVNSPGWDDSNMFNWLRLLAHVYIHPEDFAEMYYLEDADIDMLQTVPAKPFAYLANDEFADNFPYSRPKK
jgi:hypothetical protein